MPADLAPSAPPVQRESLAHFDATQPAVATTDLMATVLALLQEQKAATERLEASQSAWSDWKGKIQVSQGRSLNELEASVAS